MSLQEHFPKIQIERDKMEIILWVLAIKSIIYAILYTKPDASYILSMASRDQFNPGKGQWKMVFFIKCLKRIKNVFLVHGEDELVVRGHLDASF